MDIGLFLAFIAVPVLGITFAVLAWRAGNRFGDDK